MKKKLSISFQSVDTPITEPVTKFGGMPVWVSEPQWPISRQSGQPMTFICQIVIEPKIFGEMQGRMAYLFMTGDEVRIDRTWDPDAGENAVIIQPGSAHIETKQLVNGPTLRKEVERDDGSFLNWAPAEFAVGLVEGEDPDFIDESDGYKMDEEEYEKYCESLEGNKVGGTPGFIQYPEFPFGKSSKLLLQLNSATVPFYINFGDAGIGYAFISEDGTKGKFLWQCG
jgi:hypothetical protein